MSFPKNGKLPITDDALRTLGNVLAYSRFAMRQWGAAAQTLAVQHWASNQSKGESVFIGMPLIKERAVISERQVARHLEMLSTPTKTVTGRKRKYRKTAAAAVQKVGRELLGKSKHRRRRSVTYKLPREHQAMYDQGGFNLMPCWLLEFFSGWSERALLSCLFSRAGMADHVIGDVRDTYSLKELEKQTGLGFSTLRLAKQALINKGIIVVDQNGGSTADSITLREDCVVTFQNYVPVRIQTPGFPEVARGDGRRKWMGDRQEQSRKAKERLAQKCHIHGAEMSALASAEMSGDWRRNVI